MSGAAGERNEKRAKLVLWASVVLSLVLHSGASLALSLLPPTSVALAALQQDRIEFDVEEPTPSEPAAPEPTPEPEAEEAPEPEPVAPTPPPREQTPPPPRQPRAEAEPDPPPAAPLAEQVHDFGGQVMGMEGPGAGWSVQQANGQDTQGPIGNPVARTTGREVAGRADGEVGGTGTAAAAPAPRVNYSRPPRQPGGMAGQLERFYPAGARARGVEGRARVMIRVRADGSVEALRVVSESPAGEGFGRACMAAVQASPAWSAALDENGDPVAYRPSPFNCRFSQR